MVSGQRASSNEVSSRRSEGRNTIALDTAKQWSRAVCQGSKKTRSKKRRCHNMSITSDWVFFDIGCAPVSVSTVTERQRSVCIRTASQIGRVSIIRLIFTGRLRP
jgi:hypothetical protein